MIAGLYLEGAAWDWEGGYLVDCIAGEVYSPAPPLRLVPTLAASQPANTYRCPVYRTPTRQACGVDGAAMVVQVDLPVLPASMLPAGPGGAAGERLACDDHDATAAGGTMAATSTSASLLDLGGELQHPEATRLAAFFVMRGTAAVTSLED